MRFGQFSKHFIRLYVVYNTIVDSIRQNKSFAFEIKEDFWFHSQTIVLSISVCFEFPDRNEY